MLLMTGTASVPAQQRTVGLLLRESGACDGYTLFAPLRSDTTYLIDCEGNLVHLWPGNSHPGEMVYLLDDGSLLRTEAISNVVFKAGGGGGRIVRIGWNGNIDWSYTYRSAIVIQHHDIEPLPNGNVLLLAWELKCREDVIAAGVPEERAPADGLYPEHIVEVRPVGSTGGEIVWEWHLWDHIIQDADPAKPDFGVIAEHPERIDINAPLTGVDPRKADWYHANAVDYNPGLDQVMISVRHYSEIWVIDHGTTNEEAAGHSCGRYGRGGDLLYRWGNPMMYDRGSEENRQLHDQHDAHWIPEGLPGAGHILLFDNGETRSPQYSTVVEFTPPVDSRGSYAIESDSAFAPSHPSWSYGHDLEPRFFSRYMAGAQRLPDGNTLVCKGPSGAFIEVTPDGETVWKYVNPVTGAGALNQGEDPPGSYWSKENLVFRCTRIPAQHPAFIGKDMTPQGPIERYPSAVNTATAESPEARLYPNSPNPFNPSTTIRFSIPRQGHVLLRVHDACGRRVATLVNETRPAGMHLVHFNAAGRASGTYFYTLVTERSSISRSMLLLR